MKPTLLSVGVLTLFGALTLPASAQMCGGGQQAQASGNTASSGMMCSPAQAAADPMAEKPAQKPQASGMCPCCKNMAMMKGGMHGNMPGMDMPKAQ